MRWILSMMGYLLLFSQAAAQPYWNAHKLAKVPVLSLQGDTLVNAWTGGMNRPQFSEVDLNGDGSKELVVFDREVNMFSVFFYDPVAHHYQYSRELTSIFDACSCVNWALLADVTCDSLPDLFCGVLGTNDVAVYTQQQTGSGVSRFDLFSSALRYNYPGGSSPIPSLRVDIPALADVDKDGDLDFCTFDDLASHVNWFKNIAVEVGRCDSPVFEIESECWGHFSEDLNNNTAYYRVHDNLYCFLGANIDTSGCRPSSGKRRRIPVESGGLHAGSAILILDLDGNQLSDIVVGDVGFEGAYALYNCGIPEYAYMDSLEVDFPQKDIPIDVKFPAMFYVDTDQDGVRDLLAAPNDESVTENKNSVMRYRNIGSDAAPEFQLVERGFLQETSINLGDQAMPTFWDYNQDGLLDLLVGNVGYYSKTRKEIAASNLTLLINTGTPGCPSFQIADEDYLDIVSTFRYPNLFDIAPTAGDLDNDGDDDVILGTQEGQLYYFRNLALPGQPANLRYVPSGQISTIDVGKHTAPHLADIDSDNDLDLLIGNIEGYITFYRNEGTAGFADFVKITDKWGGVRVPPRPGTTDENVRNAKPFLFDLDNDTELELLLGTFDGRVLIYENVENALVDTLVLAGELLGKDFGEYAAPAVAYLDSTGEPSFLIGDIRGGLQLFNTLTDSVTCRIRPLSTRSPSHISLNFKAYPNPTDQTLYIEGMTKHTIRYGLVNTFGNEVINGASKQGVVTIDVSHLPTGIYWLTLKTGDYRETKAVRIQ
ncbi:MAG: FG-GAP-like repeat-containing protein [Bacteroidota bacterium]